MKYNLFGGSISYLFTIQYSCDQFISLPLYFPILCHLFLEFQLYPNQIEFSAIKNIFFSIIYMEFVFLLFFTLSTKSGMKPSVFAEIASWSVDVILYRN